MLRRWMPGMLGMAGSVVLTVLASCTDTSGPTSPGLPSVPDFQAPLSAEVLSGMERAIQDEYGAEATYQGVLDDFGNVLPFVTVVNAEERHSTSIARLYQNRSLAVPANPWTIANVPHFASYREACEYAVRDEISNVEMYDELLGMALPYDVERVFENNRRASLENHLPMFQMCAGS
jgi:hypothetical protein